MRLLRRFAPQRRHKMNAMVYVRGSLETGDHVAKLVLYGLGRGGEVQHTETLDSLERKGLESLAQERLQRFHAVEVWAGSVLVVRVRRGG